MMDLIAPHCIVNIEGRQFDSWRQDNVIISAAVELTTDKTGEGAVELFDPDFKIVDGFLGGGVKPLAAQFYYGWENNLGSAVFLGSLARVEWGDKTTTLRFHDHSAKMKQQKKGRYFKKKTDLQILEKLATDNGLSFQKKGEVKDGQPLDSYMQPGKTDWEFALKIAERAGLRLYVRENTLFVVEAGKTGDASQTLIFEQDFELLRDFNLTYKLPDNKKGRPKRTEVRGRAKGGKRLKGSITTGPRGQDDVVVREDLPKHTVSLATRRATGKTNRRREYAFEHQLRTLHSFRKIIDVRTTLRLGGMGAFFSGEYVVTDIRYDFRPGQLISEITVGRDILQ
jgi:hypothetical protein